MRKIVVTFDIPDNDLIENNLYNEMLALGCKDFKKMPDNKELYDNDKTYRELLSKVKKAKKEAEDYYFNRK